MRKFNCFFLIGVFAFVFLFSCREKESKPDKAYSISPAEVISLLPNIRMTVVGGTLDSDKNNNIIYLSKVVDKSQKFPSQQSIKQIIPTEITNQSLKFNLPLDLEREVTYFVVIADRVGNRKNQNEDLSFKIKDVLEENRLKGLVKKEIVLRGTEFRGNPNQNIMLLVKKKNTPHTTSLSLQKIISVEPSEVQTDRIITTLPDDITAGSYNVFLEGKDYSGDLEVVSNEEEFMNILRSENGGEAAIVRLEPTTTTGGETVDLYLNLKNRSLSQAAYQVEIAMTPNNPIFVSGVLADKKMILTLPEEDNMPPGIYDVRLKVFGIYLAKTLQLTVYKKIELLRTEPEGTTSLSERIKLYTSMQISSEGKKYFLCYRNPDGKEGDNKVNTTNCEEPVFSLEGEMVFECEGIPQVGYYIITLGLGDGDDMIQIASNELGLTVNAQPPTLEITSIQPDKIPWGLYDKETIFTLSGKGFSTTLSNNTVILSYTYMEEATTKENRIILPLISATETTIKFTVPPYLNFAIIHASDDKRMVGSNKLIVSTTDWVGPQAIINVALEAHRPHTILVRRKDNKIGVVAGEETRMVLQGEKYSSVNQHNTVHMQKLTSANQSFTPIMSSSNKMEFILPATMEAGSYYIYVSVNGIYDANRALKMDVTPHP